jgi:hypothetical protein
LPVACPFPHGEGSVPNLVVEMLDEAPLIEGPATTPVAVSVVSKSANAPARMPVVFFMANPPDSSRNARMPLDCDNRRTGSCLVGTLATQRAEFSAWALPPQQGLWPPKVGKGRP